MKKIVLILLVILGTLSPLSAQYASEKTVVFLLPLSSSTINARDMSTLKEPRDIDNVFARSVIGFWCGAQIAIEELADKGLYLNIIARELNGGEEYKLNQIFAEPEVQKADLIIAPVPKDIFPKVAELAQQYRIPIVNPMSRNNEIINGNHYVYKMAPSESAKAETLASHFTDVQYIIWGHNQSKPYEDYFTANNIPYTIIDEDQSFTAHLVADRENVVVACPASNNAYAQVANALLNRSKLPVFHWILPEQLLTDNGFDLTVLSAFDIYFLADFFVDDDDESVRVFRDHYARKYHTMPSLHNFAYQGYDATHFFIELINNDFHVPKDFTPLSCRLKFKREDKANGFENHSALLMRLEQLRYSIIN